ncbi:efflux RND transporter permease subunit [Nevskia soli]|uniref:efflux RND transporter permease subunit n=1 Tax=Nevskia soli TaxID=418856 RepID=UPI00068B29F3|nr:efflux RND transporter permease subunit [Nevskia soli]
MAGKAITGPVADAILRAVEPIIYTRRHLTHIILIVLTLFFFVQTMRLEPDAGWLKTVPMDHPYMQKFRQYYKDFGGANTVLVALIQDKDKGEIYNPQFMDALQHATDDVFFLPGADRARVMSIFTPNLLYVENVEGGLSGSTVIPHDYAPTPEVLQKVKSNVAKAQAIGRFVTNDQRGALIMTELLERVPAEQATTPAADGDGSGGGSDATPAAGQARAEGAATDAAAAPAADYSQKITLATQDRTQAAIEHFRENVLRVHSDPTKLDYNKVGAYLEKLRAKYEKDGIHVHIIGFAKIVHDMTNAAMQVAGFFMLTLVITGILLWIYCGSFKLGLIPLGSSIVAVIWEMGALRCFGFGMDPFAILVPFLILAVSVSHGVQYVNAWVDEVHHGKNSYDASLETFRRLAIAGTIALLTDVAGFATIYLIKIETIREMSINAVLGGLAIIVANKMLVPIWLTMIRLKNVDAFIERQNKKDAVLDKVWWWLSGVTKPGVASVILIFCGAVLGWALWGKQDLKIGDAIKGVPELRPDSRFNQDFNAITNNFQIAVDQLKVVAESKPNGCVDYQLMNQVDRFSWDMDNTPGVASSLSMLTLAKLAYQGLSEGRLNALVLPRNHFALAQATALVPTSSGMLNDDCDAIAVYMFTKDHKAETVATIVAEVKRFNEQNRKDFFARTKDVDAAYCDAQYATFQGLKKAQDDIIRFGESGEAPDPAKLTEAQGRQKDLQTKYEGMPKDCPVNFALATGNVGVMAATNEVVEAQEGRVVLWVYAVILLLLWLCFRSWRGIVCIVLPLGLVSLMGYAVMAALDIGMKVATLPVLALAVGIGVDYGIYVYGVMAGGLAEGKSLRQAYFETLRGTGKAVIFTGITLAASVTTWLMSQLQFQIDMGLLLLFMFTANMLGAILVLPAIAAFLHPERSPNKGAEPSTRIPQHSEHG